MRKLTLKDKSIFNAYLGFTGCDLAAFSFANIYIWSALYKITWEIIEESLCIFFRDKIGCFMYLPPLAKRKKPAVLKQVFAVMDRINNRNPDISRIENVPKEDASYFQALGYLCREKYPDYLCLRKDLADFKGNKFKSQRAACNYFTKHSDYRWRRLQVEDSGKLLVLYSAWARQRKQFCRDRIYCGMLDDNRTVLKKALANYKEMDFEGIIVSINQEIKGFTFGYRLNRDVFCTLYEITDLSVKGLAQFIFRKFSQELDCKYINIMDDSGLENLRKTKLSYKPARLLPAYIVTRNA